jgi:hypothetical protein
VLNARFLSTEYFTNRSPDAFVKVCYLSWEKMLLSGVLIVLFMIFASFAAYSALSDIEPSEGMRDV